VAFTECHFYAYPLGLVCLSPVLSADAIPRACPLVVSLSDGRVRQTTVSFAFYAAPSVYAANPAQAACNEVRGDGCVCANASVYMLLSGGSGRGAGVRGREGRSVTRLWGEWGHSGQAP